MYWVGGRVVSRVACNWGRGFAFQLVFKWLMTPKIILSTLAEFWKQLMGRVLRRTALKALSMALVVRTFFQWAFRAVEEGQELVQVVLDAPDGVGSDAPRVGSPLAEAQVTAVDTTRVNTSNWAYLYKWDGSSWIHQEGAFVSLTHSPAFGERLQVDFDIGSEIGTFRAGMISYKNSTGWNYDEPVEWSDMITVSAETNSDIHPPCTAIPRRAGANVTHLDWVQSSQDVDNVVVDFRALTGHNTITDQPLADSDWTFVANVTSVSEMWHWFSSNPPKYVRFAYRLKAENQDGQSLYSDWVLVQPVDHMIP